MSHPSPLGRFFSVRSRTSRPTRTALAATAASALALAGPAAAERVQVTVENLAGPGGTFLTPVFVGFHDGSGNLFDVGSAVSDGFERLAEDGSTQFLANEFRAGNPSRVAGALPGGLGAFPPPAVLGPGQTATATFELDPEDNRFFSYASMVIPSNDAFIGNDDPTLFEIFDETGDLQTLDITYPGSLVYDAGTEANTETQAAFLDQTVADAGVATDGVVTLHEGFNGSLANPDDTPVNILGGTNGLGFTFDPQAADFTRPGAAIARITITAAPNPIPSPAALPAGLALLSGMLMRRGRSA